MAEEKDVKTGEKTEDNVGQSNRRPQNPSPEKVLGYFYSRSEENREREKTNIIKLLALIALAKEDG